MTVSYQGTISHTRFTRLNHTSINLHVPLLVLIYVRDPPFPNNYGEELGEIRCQLLRNSSSIHPSQRRDDNIARRYVKLGHKKFFFSDLRKWITATPSGSSQVYHHYYERHELRLNQEPTLIVNLYHHSLCRRRSLKVTSLVPNSLQVTD